jgi:hypothetical protein
LKRRFHIFNTRTQVVDNVQIQNGQAVADSPLRLRGLCIS